MTTKIRAIKPKFDCVLVRPLAADSRTKGGLFIPEVHHGNVPYARAEVVAVGQGRQTDTGAIVPLMTKAGEIVLYTRSKGIVFPVNGEDLVLIPETAIYAEVEVEEQSSIVTFDSTLPMPPPVMSLSWENDK